jgi:Flp pilus assembly protein TadG
MEHVNVNRAGGRPQPHRRHHRHHGLATVEMALLLPFLLVLTFAAIEYGWMFYKQQQITNVARQAARLCATPNATDADVNTRANDLMAQAGFTGGQYSITINPGVNQVPTRPVTVTVSVNYPAISLTKMADSSKAVYIPAPQTLSASVSMNKEGP